MSMTSFEMDNSGSLNTDFCCTEEELFESFMEIVNDPELQSVSNEQGDIDNVSNEQSDDSKVIEEADKTANNLTVDNVESEEDSGYVMLKGNDSSDKVQESNMAECSERNAGLEQNLNESSNNLSNENASQHNSTDLTNQVDLSDSVDENLSELKTESNVDLPANIQGSPKSGDQDEMQILNDSGNVDTLVSPTDKENLDISNTELDSAGKTEVQNLQSTESEKDQSSISAETKDQNSDENLTSQSEPSVVGSYSGEEEAARSTIVQKPASPSKPEVISSILIPSPSKKKKAKETDSVEQPTRSPSKTEIISSILVQQPSRKKRGSTSDQQPTNQSENDLSSTNQNEEEGTDLTSSQQPTNESEEVIDKPSDLQSIENDIEEGIRKANQVCAELNEITQRLSRSSDELLDDCDGESDTTNGSTNLVGNAELSGNNDVLKTDSNENVETSQKSQSDEAINDDVTSVQTERPNSLPKLIVTGQPNISAPLIAPKSTTPSSLGPGTSPLDSSPLHMVHLLDEPVGRKPSMSDSLDSSEGSLSGDARSLAASPSPTHPRGPINWDILNTAFDNPETDEDEAVYETSGNYGGFGIVLDDDSPNASAVDDARLRSVSQSSTISEVAFQEEYRKSHNIGSLERKTDGALCSGYLFKLGGTGITPKNWRKRWCVLRQDRCLYYYKSARDKVPCGIIVLASYIVSHSSEQHKKHCIKLSKGGGRTYFFSSDSAQDMLRWMEVLRKAAENNEEGTNFVIRQEIIHNVAIPALSIKKPDCHGYLTKQGGKSTRSWKRRYCVLKNGCLYYYREMADTTALGVAKLHGYTVDEVSVTGRRNGFRCVPPHSGMRTFTFIADNEYDKKRWIPCFRESISVNTTT